jgi:hypothetical protein
MGNSLPKPMEKLRAFERFEKLVPLIERAEIGNKLCKGFTVKL